jgi:glycosyltransferase involved in cell wall biosynthesis
VNELKNEGMKLSIITVNYNDAEGLRKTLASVAEQTYRDIEHIIVDAASTDGSVEVIKEYVREVESGKRKVESVVWSSEPDKGIYDGMNKGIKKATGEYCQFLNSGDSLAGPDVTERMMAAMEDGIDILYGNMRKIGVKQSAVDRSSRRDEVTLNIFYRGCLNHSPAYIKRSLFDEYGYYDETLKICSDWKFYMQSIVLGKAITKHVDIVVTHFDMNGISETRKDILNEERNRLLQELVPQGILKDYDRYHFPMSQYDRLKRHHLWGLVWFIERVLFKLEKWGVLR